MFYDNFKRICAEKQTKPTIALEKIGIPSSRTGIYKKGSMPNQTQLASLAEVLGCSVMDFFWTEEELEAYEKRKSEINANALSDDEIDIISVFRKLDRKAQHQFMSYVYECDKD